MTRIKWNEPGERLYEIGVDQGVFYPDFGPGVPWNGLVAVNEDSDGGAVESLYYDGVKYMDIVANEDFSASLESYSPPVEFLECEGVRQLTPGFFVGQQPRKTFGLSYRTLLGNDLQGTDLGYKLHLVFNITASPSGKSNKTVSRDITPDTRTWQLSTVPPKATSFKPTAHLVLNSTLIDPVSMKNLEDALYGKNGSDPRLLNVQEILDIL